MVKLISLLLIISGGTAAPTKIYTLKLGHVKLVDQWGFELQPDSIKPNVVIILLKANECGEKTAVAWYQLIKSRLNGKITVIPILTYSSLANEPYLENYIRKLRTIAPRTPIYLDVNGSLINNLGITSISVPSLTLFKSRSGQYSIVMKEKIECYKLDYDIYAQIINTVL